MKKRIALIYGGAGAEREVSVMGYRNLAAYFDKEKYDLVEVQIEKNGDWYLGRSGECYPTFPIRRGGVRGLMHFGAVEQIDAAFPLLHGDFGEDGCIQGALATAGIPFVGEGVKVGALAMDKALTKTVAEAYGIPTARGFVATEGEEPASVADRAERMLGYPVFVKPTSFGSSVGAGKANNREELTLALHTAWSFAPRALVEEFIEPKRELECSFLRTAEGDIITPPGEIGIAGVYDYKSKYKSKTKTLSVAELDEGVALRVRELAERTVSALGLSVMARIDFFLSGDRLILNEVNTMPGATGESLYFRMLNAAGYSTERVIDILIDRAEVRR